MNSMKSKGMRGRARLAVAILVGAFALPGFAVADHFDCDPHAPPPTQLGDDDLRCGHYNPQLYDQPVQVPFTDTPSSITWRFGQSDRDPSGAGKSDQPVLGATLLAPVGWQFAVNTLRPSQVTDPVDPARPIGTSPAQLCTEVYLNDNVHDNDDSARLGRADNLAGGIGATGFISRTRRPGDTNPILWGYRRDAPSEFQGDITRQDPSLAFLGWDPVAGEADLCLYLYANTERVSRVVSGPCFNFPPTTCFQENEEARQHIIPIKMSKVKPGEIVGGEDISTKFGWKWEFDLTSFYGHEWLREEDIMLTDVLFYIDAISGGNWNINETTGQLEQIIFSKTPKAPGDYEFRGIFSTCANGFSDTTRPTGAQAVNLSVADLCSGGETLSVQRSVFQKILHPPEAEVYDFAKVTGPAGVLAQNETPRFGLIKGTNEVTFSWTRPNTTFDQEIKGYILQIARFGDLDNRHFQYIITDPDDAAFDAREPCGADGAEPTCSLTLEFPLSTIGDIPLDVNGRYDVALVTLYHGQNGTADKRTDGMCDDGTIDGVDCPLTDPAFRIDFHRAADINRVPGISTWQFMLRERDWPLTFLETAQITRTGARTNEAGIVMTVPAQILFVDFTTRRGELSHWNALGREERFFASSNLIVGDNSLGGVVSFQSAQMTGHADIWRFDGRILPVGGGPALTLRANGFLTQYNLRGLPGQLTPTGMPTVGLRMFASNTEV